MRHRGTKSVGFRSGAKSTASGLLNILISPREDPNNILRSFPTTILRLAPPTPAPTLFVDFSKRPTLCTVPPMSKLTLSTSFSLNHSSQYELAQYPGPPSSMPCAPTTVSCPRCRPTRLLQSSRQPQDAPRDSHSHSHNHKQLFNPKLHRPQQQHGRHVPQLLGHAADEPMDVQLELYDQDMRTRGDMVELFPTTSIREHRVRLFYFRESELFSAAAWGSSHRCARFLRGF